ncbi:AAA family ATPase [Helicobacter mesocricetorum]|uniref:AAA family ATPase n=1 Tax=Helicobacter mesocricetorum TaxID=87012 RepID=UPI000CF06C99|nr:AAA family ATPase [Helicobacter mesocricetorum]
MFIEKITICNLFAYYGKMEVEFKKSEKQNLYCIYGDNGFGKTSFIRCAKLLFFGAGIEEAKIPDAIQKFAPSVKSAKKLLKGDSDIWYGILNKVATKECQEEFFVSFEGDLGGKDFSLKRSFVNIYGEIQEKLTFKLDRESFEDGDAQERIDRILPPNLVEFFFFDGEEIGELSNNLRQEFQEKIKDLLQINPLEILIKQIEKYKDELISNQIADKEQQYRLQQKIIDKEACENNLKYNDERLKETIFVIEQKQDKIDQKNREIEKLSADLNREYAELIAERNEFDKELISYKEKLKESIKNVIFVSNEALLEDLKAEIQNLQSKKSLYDIEVFKKILPEFKEFINEELKNNEIFEVLDIKSIEYIIDKFPHKLENKESTHSFITYNELRILETSLARLENVNLAQDIKDIKDIKKKLASVRNGLYELSGDDNTREKQKALQEEIEALKNEKSKQEEKNEEIKRTLTLLEAQKEELSKVIYALKQGVNTERIDDKLKFLKSLNESIEKYKKELNNKLKDELHRLILESYKKLLPNDNINNLSINENFEIELKDENNEQIVVENQSSGQKQILAIAIFWALSRLSKSNLPLIIDTPLSRIDSKNRKNIIQNYYASSSQVIILPHTGEIGMREYEYAKSYIAGLYKIENPTNRQQAKIKKVFKIEEIL